MVQVRKRADGRYEARVQRDGRRYSIYGRTEAEVLAKLAELERRLALDQPPPVNLTVRQLCERWFETEQRRWKPRTAHDYRRLLERFVYPSLGRVRLARLGPDRLQRFFDSIPGRAGSQVFRVLHRAFQVAVRWGWLPSNPADRVVPPTYRSTRPDLPGAQALARLFQHCLASDDPYAPMVGLALLSGARLGELLALRWDDVDLDAGVIHIRRAGQWIAGEWVEAPPKTMAGRRAVPIGPLGVRLLKRQRAVVAERRLQAGQDWQEMGLVFPNTHGKPLQGSVVLDALRRLCQQAGVPRLTCHGLRHAAASLALSVGVPLPDVSRRLGHANVDITAKTYSHAISDGRTVALAIEQALGE